VASEELKEWQESMILAQAAAIKEAVAAERERCIYWCDMGDHEGFTTHHIKAGTPAPVCATENK
jgi:hypothetical protein